MDQWEYKVLDSRTSGVPSSSERHTRPSSRVSGSCSSVWPTSVASRLRSRLARGGPGPPIEFGSLLDA